MFNWWTFLLEIINFLILVYILKRLLYGPIVGVIRKRREKIQNELAELERGRAELEAARRRHEETLGGLEEMRERIVAEARAEAEKERRRILEVARQEARQEQERQAGALAAERERVMREVQERVAEAALAVSERLLGAVAGHSLHQALLAAGERELLAVTAEEAARAMRSLPEPRLTVVSARELTAAQRQGFERALERLPRGTRLELSVASALGAGARIELGELVLDATLGAQLEQVRRQVREALGEAEEAPAGGGEP